MTDEPGSRNESSASHDASEVDALVREVAGDTPLPPHVEPSAATMAVLCTLARRLTRGEAQQVLSSLPAGLHPQLHPCARHRGDPTPPFGRETFLSGVAEHLDVDTDTSRKIVQGLFRAFRRRISDRAAHDLTAQLPRELVPLWREQAAR